MHRNLGRSASQLCASQSPEPVSNHHTEPQSFANTIDPCVGFDVAYFHSHVCMLATNSENRLFVVAAESMRNPATFSVQVKLGDTTTKIAIIAKQKLFRE